MKIPIHPNAKVSDINRMARGLRCRVVTGEDGRVYLQTGRPEQPQQKIKEVRYG